MVSHNSLWLAINSLLSDKVRLIYLKPKTALDPHLKPRIMRPSRKGRRIGSGLPLIIDSELLTKLPSDHPAQQINFRLT